MTRRDDQPDLEQAAKAAEESKRRAEQELKRARESAGRAMSLARRLQRLRQENGFREIFLDALRGSSG